jgi:hypothetical protein
MRTALCYMDSVTRKKILRPKNLQLPYVVTPKQNPIAAVVVKLDLVLLRFVNISKLSAIILAVHSGAPYSSIGST